MTTAEKFVVACPHCRAKMNCSRRHLGTSVTCVKCRQSLQVPSAREFDQAAASSSPFEQCEDDNQRRRRQQNSRKRNARNRLIISVCVLLMIASGSLALWTVAGRRSVETVAQKPAQAAKPGANLPPADPPKQKPMVEGAPEAPPKVPEIPLPVVPQQIARPDLRNEAFQKAVEIVANSLSSPKSAEFSEKFVSVESVYPEDTDRTRVSLKSHVDSQSNTGVMQRQRFDAMLLFDRKANEWFPEMVQLGDKFIYISPEWKQLFISNIPQPRQWDKVISLSGKKSARTEWFSTSSPELSFEYTVDAPKGAISDREAATNLGVLLGSQNQPQPVIYNFQVTVVDKLGSRRDVGFRLANPASIRLLPGEFSLEVVSDFPWKLTVSETRK